MHPAFFILSALSFTFCQETRSSFFPTIKKAGESSLSNFGFSTKKTYAITAKAGLTHSFLVIPPSPYTAQLTVLAPAEPPHKL